MSINDQSLYKRWLKNRGSRGVQEAGQNIHGVWCRPFNSRGMIPVDKKVQSELDGKLRYSKRDNYHEEKLIFFKTPEIV